MLSPNTILHLAGALVFSAGAGIAIANETVGMMRSDSYRTGEMLPSPVCTDCSDRTRGYQWAASERIASVDACGNAPWAFREGCRAYLGEERF